MDVQFLRYFLAVAQQESITKAAEVLHITQPTLSRQIAQAEEELGVKLFARGTRRLSLTTDGLLLRRRAEEILELVDKTERELAELGEEKSTTPGQLAIAWVLAQKPYIVPIPGMRSVKRLEENAKAAELALSPEDLATIDAILAAV